MIAYLIRRHWSRGKRFTVQHSDQQPRELMNVDRQRVRAENCRCAFIPLHIILLGRRHVARVDVAQSAQNRANLGATLLCDSLNFALQPSASHRCEFTGQAEHENVADGKNLSRNDGWLPGVRINRASGRYQDRLLAVASNVFRRRLGNEIAHRVPERIVGRRALSEVKRTRTVSGACRKAVTHSRKTTSDGLVPLQLLVEVADRLLRHIDELVDEAYRPRELSSRSCHQQLRCTFVDPRADDFRALEDVATRTGCHAEILVGAG